MMRRIKEKTIKKAKSQSLNAGESSAELPPKASPSFQIEVDLNDKRSPSLKQKSMGDETSIRSSASKSTMKNSKTKKKKKKESQSTNEDELSLRSESKQNKKARKKKKTEGDDTSVGTAKSSRSTRSKKSARRASKRMAKNCNDNLPIEEMSFASHSDLRRISMLEEENAALFEETITIRRQLNDAENLLSEFSMEQNPQSKFDMMRELETAQLESKELKFELEEYEDAVIEKDELIQKLTEAVDAQLDKVEFLEAKLLRAEDDFCAMEEDFREMEDVIEDLRSKSYNEMSFDEGSGLGTGVDLRKELEERERLVERKEQYLMKQEDDLRERETLIQQKSTALEAKQNQRLRHPESLRSDIESDDDEISSREQELSNEITKLQAKISELVAENNDLWDENESIRQQNSEMSLKEDYSEDRMEGNNVANLKKKISEIEAENNDLWRENECLRRNDAERKAEEKGINEEQTEEMKEIHEDVIKKIADMNIENKILRQELDDLKKRKNADNETLRQEIEVLRKKKAYLVASSRHVVRMESMKSMRKLEVGDTQEWDDDCNLEMEVEIAELREKIVEQEEFSRRQKQEIAKVFAENEETKQELRERETELREIENQLSLSKTASIDKLSQKDKTITFMQNEMMKIMQEKQQLDKKLREQNLIFTEQELLKNQVDDETEREKLTAVNSQLRQLDEENRRLEEELKETKYNNSVRLKEKQSVILELQDELSDAKWELGAREQGADYITLLKDRKQNKKVLNRTRKELKVAKEKVIELELQVNEAWSSKRDLEKELTSFNASIGSIGSSDHLSGLKRQIKSLKQHNIALERRLESGSREFQDRLGEKEAKVRILEFELKKMRSSPQTARRGILTDYIPGFGRKNGEANVGSADNKWNDEVSSPKNEKTKNHIESTPGHDEQQSKKTGGAGHIWNLFSPRKESSRERKRNHTARLSLSTWDHSSRPDDSVDTEGNEIIASAVSSEILGDGENEVKAGTISNTISEEDGENRRVIKDFTIKIFEGHGDDQ